jgi:hypothetical protein
MIILKISLVVFKLPHNARVYELLRLPAVAICGRGLPKRFVIELSHGNQKNKPTKTRRQQWLIHAVSKGTLSVCNQ